MLHVKATGFNLKVKVTEMETAMLQARSGFPVSL